MLAIAYSSSIYRVSHTKTIIEFAAVVSEISVLNPFFSYYVIGMNIKKILHPCYKFKTKNILRVCLPCNKKWDLNNSCTERTVKTLRLKIII